jgi:hypothetical protein
VHEKEEEEEEEEKKKEKIPGPKPVGNLAEGKITLGMMK